MWADTGKDKENREAEETYFLTNLWMPPEITIINFWHPHNM
jgi:hypothetical protein